MTSDSASEPGTPAPPSPAPPSPAPPNPAPPNPAPLNPAPLNPAQRRVLDILGSPVEERPVFDPGLSVDLRASLEEAMASIAAALPEGESLWVNKHLLGQVHGCEAKLIAEHDEPFAWSPPRARGTVTHKAIELLVHWRGEVTPLDLIDEALASLESKDNSLAVWLSSCSELERAELRAQTNERVSKFVETFPPLRKQWVPVTETGLRIELAEGRVVLQGRIDLTLGQPRAGTAGKVIIDLKTGGFVPTHLDDLRYYALLETLRLGTPPRLLATYYLDSGEPRYEAVTEDQLESAMHRTIDGCERIVQLLHHDHEPVRRPGPACRWCSIQADCTEGRAWLESRDVESP